MKAGGVFLRLKWLGEASSCLPRVLHPSRVRWGGAGRGQGGTKQRVRLMERITTPLLALARSLQPHPALPARSRTEIRPGLGRERGRGQRPACANKLGVKLSARRSSDPYRGSALPPRPTASREQPKTAKKPTLNLFNLQLERCETSPAGRGKGSAGMEAAVEQHQVLGMGSPLSPPTTFGAFWGVQVVPESAGSKARAERAPIFGTVPPRRLGEVRSLCLCFPTCGNKYLPVEPSQLLPS